MVFVVVGLVEPSEHVCTALVHFGVRDAGLLLCFEDLRRVVGLVFQTNVQAHELGPRLIQILTARHRRARERAGNDDAGSDE